MSPAGYTGRSVPRKTRSADQPVQVALQFGQPRQEELVEFLGADRSDDDLLRLASRLRIDLSPPDSDHTPN